MKRQISFSTPYVSIDSKWSRNTCSFQTYQETVHFTGKLHNSFNIISGDSMIFIAYLDQAVDRGLHVVVV